MRKSFKVMLSAVAVGSFALVGCMNDSTNGPQSREEGFATVGVSVKTTAVNALGKAALGKAANFDSLKIDSVIVKLTSVADTNGTDIRDTIDIVFVPGNATPFRFATNMPSVYTQSGVVIAGVNFNSNPYQVQNLTGAEFQVRALRDWKIDVTSFTKVPDSENLGQSKVDTLHAGSGTLPLLFAGQKRDVSVNAASLYRSYQAKFYFPGTIKSSSSSDSQVVNITRIQFLLDTLTGVNEDGRFVAVDSLKNFHVDNDTITIVYSGRTSFFAGYDSLHVKVFGQLPDVVAGENDGTAWEQEQVLYENGRPLSTLSAGNNTPLNLAWKGPLRGVSALTIGLAAVESFNFVAVTPPVVLDKVAR